MEEVNFAISEQDKNKDFTQTAVCNTACQTAMISVSLCPFSKAWLNSFAHVLDGKTR